MMRALVTGGSGFIGQHLVSELVARGRQVRVLDVRLPTRVVEAVDYVRGSVVDSALVHDAMDGVDEVYHLAGLPGMWKLDRSDFYNVNFRERRTSWTPRADTAWRGFCIAQRSPFFSRKQAKRCRRRGRGCLAERRRYAGSLYTLENAR